MPVNMGDALKSQKKGLKMDVMRMGYTGCVWSIGKTVERLCVEETICETGPLGK